MPDVPLMEDDAPVVQTTTPESQTMDNQTDVPFPRLELVVPMITYEKQGMVLWSGGQGILTRPEQSFPQTGL